MISPFCYFFFFHEAFTKIKPLWNFLNLQWVWPGNAASTDCRPVHSTMRKKLLFATSQSTIFQLCLDGSSWVEPVLRINVSCTTHWHLRGSNLQPLDLKTSTLPLSHWRSKDLTSSKATSEMIWRLDISRRTQSTVPQNNDWKIWKSAHFRYFFSKDHFNV